MSGFSQRFPIETRAKSVSNTRSYLFTGPDGVQYRWALGAMGMSYPRVSSPPRQPVSSKLNHSMKLVTADEKQTVIAEFHPPRSIAEKRKARLEVQAAGVGMLDYVVLTFVFADTKRRERESTTCASGGGTGVLFFLLYHHLVRR